MAEAKGTNVTPKEFDEIKLLLNAGVPKTKIQELKRRSYGVVHLIDQVNDFEGYKEETRKRYQNRQEENGEKDKRTESVQDSKAVITLLERINDNLSEVATNTAEIAGAVKALRDCWE